jgi:hypothetical protein
MAEEQRRRDRESRDLQHSQQMSKFRVEEINPVSDSKLQTEPVEAVEYQISPEKDQSQGPKIEDQYRQDGDKDPNIFTVEMGG